VPREPAAVVGQTVPVKTLGRFLLGVIALLGTVAVRAPFRELKWNSRRLKITNDKYADSLLRRTYRSGWGTPPTV